MDDRSIVENRVINLVLTAISGTAGLTTLFLPFIWSESPWSDKQNVSIFFSKTYGSEFIIVH